MTKEQRSASNTKKAKSADIWFKLYINDIKIKGSRVTLDNGGVKVHLNLNNLDLPSRASAIKGHGYVKLNTYYAMSLFGMSEAKPKKVKDYREAKPIVTTYEGPSTNIADRSGILAFNKAWDDQLKRMIGYDTITHLRNIGVRGLAA